MPIVDNNCEVTIRNKNPEKAQKQQENKNKLISDIIEDMFDSPNSYDYEDFKIQLCREGLNKMTQKTLKEILGYDNKE